MNTQTSRARRVVRIKGRAEVAKPAPAKAQSASPGNGVQPETLAPDRLPQPWLVDSEYLLAQLARIRELALHVPCTLDTYLPTNAVVDALWRLEEQLRYVLSLQRDMERDFVRKASQNATHNGSTVYAVDGDASAKRTRLGQS